MRKNNYNAEDWYETEVIAKGMERGLDIMEIRDIPVNILNDFTIYDSFKQYIDYESATNAAK